MIDPCKFNRVCYSIKKYLIINMKIEEFKYLLTKDHKILIVKFGAEWCKPCQNIKPYINELLTTYKIEGLVFQQIEVNLKDDELYSLMKRRRLIQGIPAFCLYYRNKYDEDLFYVPDETIIGADKVSLNSMFKRASEYCNNNN